MIIGITPLLVGMITDKARLEGIEKSVRTIIDGKTEHRHVVGIQHAMSETNQLPLRYEPGSAFDDLAQ